MSTLPGLSPRVRRQRRWAAALAVVVATAWLISAEDGPRRPTAAGGAAARTTEHDPFAFQPSRRAEYERRAEAGLSRVLYAKSPGGIVASAGRTAAFRSLVEAAAKPAGIDPDDLEALVLLESAGRPTVMVGNDPQNAAGLTQIVAGTATDLLGMHVDVARSRSLAKRIARAQRRSRPQEARRLEVLRKLVDERFDPAHALRATVRYLTLAKRRFGRDDLALASYHMGMGNLETALRAYAGIGAGTPIAQLVREQGLTYAQLYFGSSPVSHAAAAGALARLGDDSSNYLWKLHAARTVMALYRSDRAALVQRSERMLAKASAEEVLIPAGSVPIYANAEELRTAYARHRLQAFTSLAPYGLRVSRALGAQAKSLDVPAALYRGLAPAAFDVLTWMGVTVRRLSGAKAGLVLTSAVRDVRYQRSLVGTVAEATQNYSLHTTGYAFDIARRYASDRQALAFQAVLDRLTALNLIAWIREPTAIHVTVAPDAAGWVAGP